MSDQKPAPTADDQDAAALLMLFQSQSNAPSAQPASATAAPAQTSDTKEAHATTKPQETEEPQAAKEPEVEPKKELSPAADVARSLNTEIQQRPDLSAKSSASGSNHSRSNSGNNFSTSPGPAAAALAESNKKFDQKNPNNIKAMVAAAALAAAAATPFPLLSHEIRRENTAKTTGTSATAAVSETTTDTEPLAKQEDSEAPVMTDTEDTADKQPKTEDVSDKTDAEADDNEEEIENILETPSDAKQALAETSQEESSKAQGESSYYTDPDSGTIGCVCEYDHDDGFTIQCDRCYRWQHASCMGIKSMDEVPEFYLCYLCDRSRKVNKAKAREAQRDFLMPTSKRKRLNSIDNEALREEIVHQVTSLPADEPNDDDAKRRTTPVPAKEKEVLTSNSTTKGRKQKPPPKKETPDAVDDTELFMNSKDGYKTVYFPLSKCEFRDEHTKFLFEKLQPGRFKQMIEMSSQDLRRKLGRPQITVKPFAENLKLRFSGFSRFSVNVENSVGEGDFVLPVVGEVQMKQDYIDNPFNHYNIWGVAKPKVFFLPEIPFVVDARYSGNEARFLRRSCNPSCELKTIYLKNEKTVRFVISALRPLKIGQELTLPWDWDPAHPINKIISGKTFDQLGNKEKPVLVRSIETVLNGCECACTNNNECYLYKVRKALAYLYRSTRKVNIPTFGNNLSKYADIYRQRDESYHVAVQQRLEERDRIVYAAALQANSAHKISSDDEENQTANGSAFLPDADPNDSKREFHIKKHGRGPPLEPELLPYKYRIVQSSLSTTGHPVNQTPRTFLSEEGATAVNVTTSTDAHETEAEKPSEIDSFPIPVPILKPVVINRVPSISGDNQSAKGSLSSIGTGSAADTAPTRIPIKKKMSLKDYMKNKKK